MNDSTPARTEEPKEGPAESPAESPAEGLKEDLREKYLQLINHQLPEKAKQVSMPVRFNHCFARIVLDNLFEGCWYEHLSRKLPAYKQLDERQLLQAIEIAEEILKNPETASQLNLNSLHWRGKARS